LNLVVLLIALVQQNPSAEFGHGVFRLHCAPCHGMAAQGGRSGPDLTRLARGDNDLFDIITNGVPGTEMQAYGDSITSDARASLVAYLRSKTQSESGLAPGNAAKGEQLFWGKGGCGACHLVGKRGERIGPALTRIGGGRSLAHLKESIVDPNADPVPGYSTVTVVERNGTTVTGVEKGFDNFTVRLVDLSQKFHSYDLSAVAKVTRSPESLMPADYGKKLSSTEIDDLVAYLASLKGSR
jgi:putative heme-binding domain-containing protein